MTTPVISDAWLKIAPKLNEIANEAMDKSFGFQWDNILPAKDHVFRAFNELPPSDVKVVLLGQDPYPTPGHPMGLCFSVPDGQPWARTLNNIAKEYEADLGFPLSSSDLSPWVSQGILMANTALTVEAGNAGAHTKQWKAFTLSWIKALSQDGIPRVWVLWGDKARVFADIIREGAGQQIIESAHPSPLSARRGFFGSSPFSSVNNLLTEIGRGPVNWEAKSKNSLF